MYDFTNIELGAEWLLLGSKEPVVRVLALADEVESSGGTNLPKVFIGGLGIHWWMVQ